MPMDELRGGDDDVAAAEQRGVAREAAARVDADERHEPGEPAPVVERPAVEPGDAGAVGVARTAAAALGEEDDRQPQLRAPARTGGPSCGGSGGPACRRGRCSRRRARRSASAPRRRGAPFTRPMPATSPSAGVRSIRSSTGAAAALRRDHERAVLDERPGIAEVVDVLARGALPGLAAALDRVGPRGVERAARGGDAPRRGRAARGRGPAADASARPPRRDVALLEHDERRALETVSPAATRDARARRRPPGAVDHVLHLHGLHDEELRARRDRVARARRRRRRSCPAWARARDEAVRPRRSLGGRGAGSARRAAPALPVREHRERIAPRRRARRRGRDRRRRGVPAARAASPRAASSSASVVVDEASCRRAYAGERRDGASERAAGARGSSRRRRCGTRRARASALRAAPRRSRATPCTTTFASSESKLGLGRQPA